MNFPHLYRFLLFTILTITIPVIVSANQSGECISDRSDITVLNLTDSTSKKQPVKPDDKKEEVKKPDIKEVPKSKRQIKPIAVGARIKIKTPVKIRPNIKRPLGLIRKSLGR